MLQRLNVAFDAEIEQIRRRSVGAALPVVLVVLPFLRWQQLLLGVGVVGVRDNIVGEELLAVFGSDRKAAFPAGDLIDRLVGDVLDAEFFTEVDHRVDERAKPAFRVVDTHVEIDVAHQVVERGRVLWRSPEEHEGVLHDLLELGVFEVVRNVALHLSKQREPPGVPEHVGIDVVSQAGSILVDEVFHPDIVGVLGFVEIPV